MMLSDRQIRMRMAEDRWSNGQDEANWRIRIAPMPADGCFQPHSIDLTLFHEIKIEAGGPIFGEPAWNPVDVRSLDMHTPDRLGQYPLMPNQFILASTVEKVFIPHDLCGRADGKSSIGRRGVGIHVTAGLLDAGWEGQITLEVTNSSSYVFWLKPGMKICQLTFEQLTSPAERPYGHPELGSHYQSQSGPTVSVL